MNKWIITTVLLICICAGVVAYAIIAPDFNISEKDKQTTTENQSYTIKQPIRGCEVTIKEIRIYSEDRKNGDNEKLLEVEMSFTNPSQEAKKFVGTVGVTAYQDGLQLESCQAVNPDSSLKVRDGATTKAVKAFLLRNDSDVTLDFSEAYMPEVIDSISYSIK